jgi:hypothetical protein
MRNLCGRLWVPACLILGIGLGLAGLTNRAHGDLIEGFEAGYADGSSLDGQAGWIATQYSNDFRTLSTAGRLPGGLWGVESQATNAGAKKAHGVDTSIGQFLQFSLDLFAANDNPTYSRAGLQSMSNPNVLLSLELNPTSGEQWVGFEVLGDKGYSRFGNDFWDQLVAGEWYRADFEYEFGGGAEFVLTRYSNGAQTTRSISSSDISSKLADLQWLSLDGFYIEGWTGSRYDNISISAVPEPTSLSIFSSLSLAWLAGKRRRR